jgi:SAM-dependent methyltransferase
MQCYDYAGGSSGLIVESARVQLLQAARQNVDASMHSRYSTFGRTAYLLCRGAGLEIGAMSRSRFDLDANVTYLDCSSRVSLRDAGRSVRPAQLAWSGSSYSFLNDDAFDFVINNHILDRADDPRCLIEEWLRVIRPGGTLYMVVLDGGAGADDAHGLSSANQPEPLTRSQLGQPLRSREVLAPAAVSHSGATCSCGEADVQVSRFSADSLHVFLLRLKESLDFDLELFQNRDAHVHVVLRKGSRRPF